MQEQVSEHIELRYDEGKWSVTVRPEKGGAVMFGCKDRFHAVALVRELISCTWYRTQP